MAKKIIIVLMAILLLSALWGCDQKPNGSSDDKTSEPEREESLSPMERLEQETGYRQLKTVYYDLENIFTVTFQRELVGGVFLESGLFDIAEYGNRLVLSLADSWYDYLFIELTEEQYRYICDNGGWLGTNVAIAFQIDNVIPVPVSFTADYDYDMYSEVFSNNGKEYEEELIDPDSMESFIQLSDHYRIIYGTCVDVFNLGDG